MRTAEEIAETWVYRRDRATIVTNRMRRIRDAYNGDLILPFDDEADPAVANLILVGIEQKAGRIASVRPQVWFPAEKPGVKVSEEKAITRRDAILGWWDTNSMTNVLKQRSRHLVAYGASHVVLRPDPATGCPRWIVRNPLGSYPAEELASPLVPADMLTAYNQTWGKFRRMFPSVAARHHATGDVDDSSQVLMIEYSDAEQVSLVYCGLDATWEPGLETMQFMDNAAHGTAEFVVNIPNRAGVPLGVAAQRTTLDRQQGEFDQAIGPYGAQAKLAALEIAAVERDVFPDTYLVARPNENPRFIAGPFDGRTGQVNIVAGGDVKNLASPAGYQTGPMVDRLERYQRITAGVPAEFGGESTQNVRTGRRGDAILSAIVDFPIAETQDVIASSLEAEDRIAVAIAKSWGGDRPQSFHYIDRRRVRSGDYVPDKLFDTSDFHKITYPVAGADLNALTVGIGQRMGLGILSKRSAAELDPMVDDPELEHDRITAETLEAAVLASIQTAAVEGALPPSIIARVTALVRSGKAELPEALEQAQAEEAEKQQAAAQPQAGAGIMAQMAAEGMGGPQAAPSVAEGPQGLQNLAGLYSALRKTNTRDAGRAALGGSF